MHTGRFDLSKVYKNLTVIISKIIIILSVNVYLESALDQAFLGTQNISQANQLCLCAYFTFSWEESKAFIVNVLHIQLAWTVK